jgi:carotenoid cleavage dioxygenase-like enzyme
MLLATRSSSQFKSFIGSETRVKKLKVLQIPWPRSVMMHDFAITETHAIFLDNPHMCDLQKKCIPGELPFQFEPKYGSRVGIIPLNAQTASDIQWFELPQSTFMFHTMNAWNEALDDEGHSNKNEVVVAQYDDMPPFGGLGAKPNPYRVRLWKLDLGGTSLQQGSCRYHRSPERRIPGCSSETCRTKKQVWILPCQ